MNDEHRSHDSERLEPPLDAAVQAIRVEPLPEDAVERVKTRARQLAATSIADSHRRSWRISPAVAACLALAASLLVLVTSVVLLLDRSGGQAFAQMIENVKTAGSVRFTIRMRFGQQPGGVARMYLEGNRMRFEQADGVLIHVADFERNKVLTLDMHGKQFQTETIDKDAAQQFGNPIDQLRRVKSDDAESIGKESLRGRRTQVYRFRNPDFPFAMEDADAMVWVDVESELPAKIVIRNRDPKQPFEFVYDNFTWNEPLDPQLFSLAVPEGFQPNSLTWVPEAVEPDAVEPDAAPAFVDGVLRDRVPASILWSPEGTTITALMRNPDSIPPERTRPAELRQWDIATGKLRWSEMPAGAWLAATRDRKLLATVVGNEVQLRDATTGQIIRSWVTDERLLPLAFSPDGKTLAAGINEWGPYGGRGGEPSELPGGVQLWDVEQARLVRTTSDEKPTTFVKYSMDGNYLVTSSNEGPVKLWDVATGELTRLFPGRLRADFSPDGETIAFPSAAPHRDETIGRVELYNLADGSLVKSFASEKGPSASWLLCVTFSPDGRLLAATDRNGIVTLWDVATGRRLWTITDHEADVGPAAFAPDGAVLATGSEDKTLRLWKLPAELIQPESPVRQ